MNEYSLAKVQIKNMSRPACRAVLSKAVVTRDTVPGLDAWGELSVRQYLAIYLVWYEVLPSRQLFSIDIPRASPSVTTASLSIAFQAIPHNVTVFFSFGSERKRIRSFRLVQPYRLVFNCFAILEKVYFLFIALKRMETFARRWCQTYGLGDKSLLL